MTSQSVDPNAERLLRARQQAGYGSAQEVADAFGWPDYPLDEGGERALTAVRAKLYAHAFHVDPERLLSGNGEAAAGSGTASDRTQAADELAERISRLTTGQRAALVAFLRSLQEG
jgi:hypothetical protein